MKNVNFLDQLKTYKTTDPIEKKFYRQTLKLLKTTPECYKRTEFCPGHITAGAFIINLAFSHLLMNHHKKLDMWIHFGGHSDDNPNSFDVALREVNEESGLKSFMLHPKVKGIFDIDIQTIPHYKNEPKHLHYDIRYLLIAGMDKKFNISDESTAIRWVKFEDVEKLNDSDDLKRVLGKIRKLIIN